MPPLSLRSKLTLWCAALFSLMFFLIGGVSYRMLSNGLARDVDASLESVGTAISKTLNGSSSGALPGDLEEILRDFLGPEFSERFFQLLDPFGRFDPRSPGRPREELSPNPEALRKAAKGIPTFSTIPGQGRYPSRILTLPVIRSGRVSQILQVGMSLEGVYMARRRFLLTLAILGPLAILLAGGGGWLLARWALVPVDRMVSTARRIGGTNLEERINHKGIEDELGRLARTLNEMLERLESSFKQTRQFTADAAHELRTPLTALKGEMELALRSAQDPAEYQRVIASNLEEIEHLSRLVEDLLLLSRADAGALGVAEEYVDLEALVAEAVRRAGVLAEARSVALRSETSGPLPVTGDTRRLIQVLLNLLDNAIKFTPAGGQVTVSLSRQKPWAVLSVRDTGIGIPPEEQEKIFRRFYRIEKDRSRDTGGTGLGLCIVKSLVEAHRGHIELESSPGNGTTFRVFLPLSPHTP